MGFTQPLDEKIDEVVKVLKDTVYEYDTGIALSKRAAVEIPLFHVGGMNIGFPARLGAPARHSLGFAYFTKARAPKCDYIEQYDGSPNRYFKKQADIEVSRTGSPLKEKKKVKSKKF